MADPKYAGLPGIALDQPDMFETSGGAEDELEEEESSNGDMEPAPVLHLSSLGWLGDLEVGTGGGSDPDKEGLVQKYSRLRCEAGELAEELDAMTESQREGHVAGLSVQVSDLKRRLDECELTDKTGSRTSTELESDLTKRLLRDIESLGKITKDHGDASQTNTGLYQLYIGNSVARPSIEMAVVEERLTALEQSIGSEIVGEKRVLSAATDGRSLQYAVDNLMAKKGHFQQQHLDHVEGRLAALNQKMTTIGELKSAVMMAKQEDKLSRLCGLVESQASLACVLPEITRRLEEVEQIGERAASWPEVLNSTEQNQQNTKKTIGDTKEAVEATRKTFEDSLASVADQFSQLQKRLATISC